MAYDVARVGLLYGAGVWRLPGERGPSSEYLEAPEYLELEADDVTRQDRRNV